MTPEQISEMFTLKQIEGAIALLECEERKEDGRNTSCFRQA